MSRSITMVSIRVKKARVRGPAQFQALDALDGGIDLFDFVRDALDQLTSEDLSNHVTHRYLSVDEIKEDGRCIVARLHVGAFGEHGIVKDVASHSDKYTHGASEAPTTLLRVAFVLPRASRLGVMFVEHSNRQSGGVILDKIKHVWRDQGHSSILTIETDAVFRPSAWMKSAELQKVRAVTYGHESNLEDQLGGANGKVIGDMVYTLVPDEKRTFIPRKLWERLRDSSMDRAKLLGVKLPEGEDFDEIKVTLGQGGESKTFILGKEKTPAIRIQITDAAGDTARDDEFLKFCIKQCPEVFVGFSEDWQTSRLQ